MDPLQPELPAREGALDPALVVRKATLYGVLGAILVFLVAGLENLVTDWLVDRLGVSDRAGLWIVAGVIAVVIGPLHERLRRRTDRLLAESDGVLDAGVGEGS